MVAHVLVILKSDTVAECGDPMLDSFGEFCTFFLCRSVLHQRTGYVPELFLRLFNDCPQQIRNVFAAAMKAGIHGAIFHNGIYEHAAWRASVHRGPVIDRNMRRPLI